MVELTQNLSEPTGVGIQASGPGVKPAGFNAAGFALDTVSTGLTAFAKTRKTSSKTDENNPFAGNFLEIEKGIAEFNAGDTNLIPESLAKASETSEEIRQALAQGSITPAMAQVARRAEYTRLVAEGNSPELVADALEFAVESPLSEFGDVQQKLVQDQLTNIQNEYIKEFGTVARTVGGNPDFNSMQGALARKRSVENFLESQKQTAELSLVDIADNSQDIVLDRYNSFLSMATDPDLASLEPQTPRQIQMKEAAMYFNKLNKNLPTTPEEFESYTNFLDTEINALGRQLDIAFLKSPETVRLSSEKKKQLKDNVLSVFTSLKEKAELHSGALEAMKNYSVNQKLSDVHELVATSEALVQLTGGGRETYTAIFAEDIRSVKNLGSGDGAFALGLGKGIQKVTENVRNYGNNLIDERGNYREPEDVPIAAIEEHKNKGMALIKAAKQASQTNPNERKSTSRQFQMFAKGVRTQSSVEQLYKELEDPRFRNLIKEIAEEDPLEAKQFFEKGILKVAETSFINTSNEILSDPDVADLSIEISGKEFKIPAANIVYNNNPRSPAFNIVDNSDAIFNQLTKFAESRTLKTEVEEGPIQLRDPFAANTPPRGEVIGSSVQRFRQQIERRKEKLNTLKNNLNRTLNIFNAYDFIPTDEKSNFDIFGDSLRIITRRVQNDVNIPPEAIEQLRENPDDQTRRDFDEAFGQGQADAILSE